MRNGNSNNQDSLEQLATQRQQEQQHLIRPSISSPNNLRRMMMENADNSNEDTNGGNTTPNESPLSCWSYEATTPMTTRPHFSPQLTSRSFSPSRFHWREEMLKRGRSKSFGNHEDGRRRRYHEQGAPPPTLPGVGAPRFLMIPPLKTIVSNQALNDPDQQEQYHQQEKEQTRIQTEKVEQLSTENSLQMAETGETAGQEPEPIAIHPPSSSTTTSSNFLISIMYGVINATIVLPVLMSFSSIIYQDPIYMPYMPVLVKLTICSGIVHQVCFSTFSSLPFAVGSVQDAGLLFLSSMTRDLVALLAATENGMDPTTLLATTVVALSIATAVLGLGLILVGRGKLARYVQLLPTCVVAGYLAFIGWFCGVSGVRLMAATQSDSGTQESLWQQLWQDDQYKRVLPGLLGGLFIYGSVRRLRHMAVLPSCILLLLAIFYACLWWTQTSLEQATEQGWIRPMDPPPAWYKTWDFFQFDKVQWSVLPHLLLTEVGMIVVVALSSSLDVAAIELELKQPLDYDRELTTVGISNMLSGLAGGYTGSYIFSQTIFSLRAGITSRTSGYALAACQLAVVLAPVPLLSFVPNFLFGSLLTLICVDLVYEWLWDVRTRVTKAEHGIDLATFGLIQWLGVEYGILAGILVFLACQKAGLDVGQGNYEEDGDPTVSKPGETDKLLMNGEATNESGETSHYSSLEGYSRESTSS